MNRLSFTIFVTTICNMKCSYCYENEYEQENMSLKVAERTVEFICEKLSDKKPDLLDIKFHGGEPLIAFDIIRFIVLELNKKVDNKLTAIKYSMTTNGTLYTQEMCDILKRFSSISISIDGFKEIHDKNRRLKNGTGSYDTLIFNVKKMLDSGLNLTARMTVTNETYKDLLSNFQSIVNIGITNIEIEVDFTNSNWTTEKLETFEENLKKIADMVYSSESDGIYINLPLLTYAKNKTKNTVCDGGNTSFSITPLGDIYPCLIAVYKPEFALGTIGGKINGEIINLIDEVGQIKNQSCDCCSRYDYCTTTRCKIINKIYMGDYHIPSPIICAYENLVFKIGKYYSSLFD